jgi:hypothetical protein
VCDIFAGFAHGLIVRWLHREAEIISAEDAAVTEFARLSAGGKLYEAGTSGHIYGESDAFLTTDYVTVACGYVPYFKRYAFLYLLHLVATLAIGQAAGHEPRALGYATEL